MVKKDPGRARQKSLATAGTNSTKPGAQNKVNLCILSGWIQANRARHPFLQPSSPRFHHPRPLAHPNHQPQVESFLSLRLFGRTWASSYRKRRSLAHSTNTRDAFYERTDGRGNERGRTCYRGLLRKTRTGHSGYVHHTIGEKTEAGALVLIKR